MTARRKLRKRMDAGANFLNLSDPFHDDSNLLVKLGSDLDAEKEYARAWSSIDTRLMYLYSCLPLSRSRGSCEEKH